MRGMLIDWSQRVETWSRTKNIADRAMGSFVADQVSMILPQSSEFAKLIDMSSCEIERNPINLAWS
jgi:hypothetical protein